MNIFRRRYIGLFSYIKGELKMKVLLVSFNQECFPEPVFPIGAYTIAKSLVDAHQVKFIDRNMSSDEEMISMINEFEPDVVGISFRNLDNTQFLSPKSYLPELKKIINYIRSNSSVIIVIGGCGFSIMPNEILQYTKAEYGISGTGCKSFLNLLNQLEMKEFPVNPLLIDKENRKNYKETCPNKLKEINQEFNFDWYYNEGGNIGISTKKGCPHKCVYCPYPFIEGNKYQLRNIEDVVNEIQYYTETIGIRHFFFTDSIFNEPETHSVRIAKEIIKRKLSIEWTGYFNPSNLCRESIQLYKDSGCTGIDLGVESGSDRILKNYGKTYNIQKVYQIVEDCRIVNIPVLMSLLLGGPGETEQTLSETFKMLKTTNPKCVFIMAGIRIYPNTPIFQISIQEGIINDKTDLLNPHFYMAPPVKDIIFDIIEKKAKKNPNWFLPGTKMNVDDDFENPRNHGVKGALWIHLPDL